MTAYTSSGTTLYFALISAAASASACAFISLASLTIESIWSSLIAFYTEGKLANPYSSRAAGVVARRLLMSDRNWPKDGRSLSSDINEVKLSPYYRRRREDGVGSAASS